jgi:hypothetical protein
MPCEKHGKYLIVTKADYDVEKKSWHPYAHISWIEGKKFHFQQFRDLNNFSPERGSRVLWPRGWSRLDSKPSSSAGRQPGFSGKTP